MKQSVHSVAFQLIVLSLLPMGLALGGCGDDGGTPDGDAATADDAGGGGDGLTVSPQRIQFDHELGVDECPRMVGTFTITNATGSSVDYTLQSMPSGIAVAPAAGSFPDGVSQDFSVSYTCAETSSFEDDIVYSIPRGEGTITVRVEANITGG